jgi:(p)ppGpp synthase/HD superfamily hydrolase
MKAPPVTQRSELLREAFQFLLDAFGRAEKEDERDLEHSVAVGELLAAEGFDDEIVAAGLLHDVVEDTPVDLDEICRRFGQLTCELVGEMTEDAGIDAYRERKAEHRARVAGDSRVATIYAADKVAKIRQLRRLGKPVRRRKLEHYAETLRVLREAHPQLPFLDELAAELDALRREGRVAVR